MFHRHIMGIYLNHITKMSKVWKLFTFQNSLVTSRSPNRNIADHAVKYTVIYSFNVTCIGAYLWHCPEAASDAKLGHAEHVNLKSHFLFITNRSSWEYSCYVSRQSKIFSYLGRSNCKSFRNPKMK